MRPALPLEVMDMFQDFQERFYLNFIEDDRWEYLLNGLQTTLTVTFFCSADRYRHRLSCGDHPRDK